jgi:hypothetical protein
MNSFKGHHFTQTELNYDLLSRSDSMAAMTVQSLQTEGEQKRGTIHQKMKGKRARKMNANTSCEGC